MNSRQEDTDQKVSCDQVPRFASSPDNAFNDDRALRRPMRQRAQVTNSAAHVAQGIRKPDQCPLQTRRSPRDVASRRSCGGGCPLCGDQSPACPWLRTSVQKRSDHHSNRRSNRLKRSLAFRRALQKEIDRMARHSAAPQSVAKLDGRQRTAASKPRPVRGESASFGEPISFFEGRMLFPGALTSVNGFPAEFQSGG
jgi:hypothetical protein